MVRALLESEKDDPGAEGDGGDNAAEGEGEAGADNESAESPIGDSADIEMDGSNHWATYAELQCNSFATFIPLASANNEEAMVKELKATQAVTMEGRMLAIFDVKSSGESKTHPKFRLPPFRSAQMQMLVRSAMKARMPPQAGDDESNFEIRADDVYLYFDGTNHAHDKSWRDAFVHPEHGPMTSHTKHLHIMYDEESVAANLDRRPQGESGKELTEYLKCTTKEPFKFPDKKRKFFPGTCRCVGGQRRLGGVGVWWG